jgi:hypothetical protein
MSIHSDVEYGCEKCGQRFIPLTNQQKCPKCGHEAPQVFEDFIYQTNFSAINNLTYGPFYPAIYGVFTLDDQYYYLAYKFLGFAALKLKTSHYKLLFAPISEDTAQGFASEFVNHVDEKGENNIEPDCMRTVFQDYLERILCSLKPQREDIFRSMRRTNQALADRRQPDKKTRKKPFWRRLISRC